MAKIEALLLLLLSLSFALLDPPLQQVDQHNIALAPQAVLHQNVFHVPEHSTSIGNPVKYFYVRILTLTPAVNMSISGKESLHPKIIWLLAEDHNATTREDWESGDGCSDYHIRRNWGEMQIEDVSGNFVLDGLPKNQSGKLTFVSANKTLLLADSSTFENPMDIPFKNGEGGSFWCELLQGISSFIFGDGMPNMDCYSESLAQTSPYTLSTVNLTSRSQSIINPRLNATVTARISIPYDEHGSEHWWESTEDGGESCEGDSWDNEGTREFVSTDFTSYEVQNDYMTLLPYSPSALNLSCNTSEDVIYYFTLFANSNLYKYYSKMDGKTATAFYVYDFNITNDAFGTQFITARYTGVEGILPDDPEKGNNYTGSRRFVFNLSNSYLRNPYEVNNRSYNHSRVYSFKEIFYNLSDGPHRADLYFYTWFGNFSAVSDIFVRSRTLLSISAMQTSPDDVTVSCLLTSRGLPAGSQAINLKLGNESREVLTDGSGKCSVTIPFKGKIGVATGEFKGTETLLPSTSMALFSTSSALDIGQSLVPSNFALLLLLSLLLGFSIFRLTDSVSVLGIGAGGAALGQAFKKVLPFTGSRREAPKTNKDDKKEKAKKAALIVAAVLTGGAAAAAGGAAAGGAAGAAGGAAGSAAGGAAATGGKVAAEAAAKKAAEETLKKKAAEEALKKKAQEKLTSDYTEKKLRAQFEEQMKTKGKKRMGIGGGSDDDDKDKKKKSEVEKLFEDPTVSKKTKLRLIPRYLDTADKYIELRDQLKKDIEVQFNKLKDEIANITREKAGENAATEFFKSADFNKVTLHISSEEKWETATKIDPILNRSMGVTYGDGDIRINPYIIKDYEENVKILGLLGTDKASEQICTKIADVVLTDYHEMNHVLTNKLDYTKSKELCEGFADIESYRQLQQSGCDNKIKKAAVLVPDYREFSSVSYLTENIVGREDYLYAHAVKGESYLRDRFDKVAGDGAYDRVFSNTLDSDERIDELKKIVKEKVPDNAQHILDNVERIQKEGKYDL